jgi:hypothetical protein
MPLKEFHSRRQEVGVRRQLHECAWILWPLAGDLRLNAGDVPALEFPGLEGQAEVLQGRFSVEEAQARAAVRGARRGERYGSVGDYDPVLRAHCRLDEEATDLSPANCGKLPALPRSGP